MRQLVIAIVIAMLLVPAASARSKPAASLSAATVVDAQTTAQDKVTLEQAVRRVRKQYGGRILSAETRGSGARRQHVIKVLTDEGRVHTVRINAN